MALTWLKRDYVVAIKDMLVKVTFGVFVLVFLILEGGLEKKKISSFQ